MGAEHYRFLDEEAARQGVSSAAVIVQALIARGIIPGANGGATE